MAQQSKFERNLMETIWSEIKDSDFISEVVEQNITEEVVKEVVEEHIDSLDLGEYVDEAAVGDAVKQVINDIVDEDFIKKSIDIDQNTVSTIVAEQLENAIDIEAILKMIAGTPQFQKLIEKKVQEEFDKLWY